MNTGNKLSIGSRVICSDGACGELRWVVVDPITRKLTHVVVEQRHRQGMGHLVPIDLVSSSGQELRLACTKAELQALEDADETRFLPGTSVPWGYGEEEALSWPYYGLGTGGMGVGMGLGTGTGARPQPITYDRVPAGEVEVRRGDQVRATDGDIGRVQGLVIDPSDHHVTHVLLEEGHLWGKKQVAIPITAVTGMSHGVQLRLSKDEVRELPPVAIDHLK